MTVEETIAQRKSIRSYLDKEVPAENVAKIVEAGRWAPNHGDFNMSVIGNADVLKRLDEATYQAMLASGDDFLISRASLPGYRPLYGAPVLIALSAPADYPLNHFNVATAAESMLLQATELGLGSCFLLTPTFALNAEQNKALAREVGIPDDYRVQCAVVFGYIDDETKFRASEREPKGTVNYVD